MFALLSLLLTTLALLSLEVEAVYVGAVRISGPLAIALMGLVIMLHLPRLLRPMRAVVLAPMTIFFVLYLLWCALSLLWSPTPGDGAGHVVLLGITLITALVLSPEPPRQLALVIIASFSLSLVVCWAMAGLGVDMALSTGRDMVRLKGFFIHEQRLALIAGGLLLVSLVEIIHRRRTAIKWHWLMAPILLALLTLLATQTRLFTSCALLTVLLVLALELRFFGRMVLSGIVVLMSAGAFMLIDLLLPYLQRGETDQTLTARLPLWQFVWQRIEEHPLLGHGFASFLSGGEFEFVFRNFIPAHAHNTWLQSLFEVGAIGTGLYALFILFALHLSVKFYRQTGIMPFSLPILVFSLLCGLFGIVFGGKMTTLYGLSLIFLAQEAFIRSAIWTRLPQPEDSR